MKNLKNIKAGEYFTLKGIEWVCLDPDYSEGDEKGIFAIMTNLEPEMPFADEDSEHNWSDYTYSNIRTHLKEKYGTLLKDVTITHRCDLRTDNGDELYPPVYDNVFILSIFEYFRYIDYIPRYNEWHRLRSASRGASSNTWNVYTSGSVHNSAAISALACAPACIIRKSDNQRPTHRSQKKKQTTTAANFEIYEGRTEKQNRLKRYLVFPYTEKQDTRWLIDTKKAASRFFKVSFGHICVGVGYVLKDELYIDYMPRGSKRVMIAYYA